MNRRDVECESAIRTNRLRRVALFKIGFGSYLNLNAVQALHPLIRQAGVRGG